MASLIGKKIGMTQMYDDGKLIPVSIIELGPCDVVQIKTKDRDGYEAVQLGFGEQKKQRVSKPQLKTFENAKVSAKKILKEVPIEDGKEYELGSTIDVSIFEGIERVTIVGTSKGKGFAGGMKRYGFKGLPASHGVNRSHRRIGSIGMRGTPGRVLPLKKMPGHMGNVQRTNKNLKVLKIDKEKNLMLVKGTIPGPNGNVILVKKSL
ncbi:MAG: 50S ribosomal protein L3 [Planctomycetota bacterium]|nr:MAG: 50S ribosomal protein L3 [Planctomycetota bacterium]